MDRAVIWHARGLMLALPLTVLVVFLAVATIHLGDPPLTSQEAWSALAAYVEAHPDAFDGLGRADNGRLGGRCILIANNTQSWKIGTDPERRSYTIASELRGSAFTPPRREVGRFVRRWGKWVALPPNPVIDEPGQRAVRP